MADFVLRVDANVLRQKSSEFTVIINELKTHFDQIEDVSKRTKGYWQGEAGDKDRAGYESFKDEISYIIKRLQEHPVDLLKMAGLYEETEQGIVTTNEILRTDLIV